jgi:hypothetical protein
MRRVVVEVPEGEMKKLGEYRAELSREVESLEVMHHVKHGFNGSAIICRVRPKVAKTKLREMKFRFKKFEILSEEKDGMIVYLEAEAAPLAAPGQNPPKVFLNFPFEIRQGKRRITFLGESAELKKLFRWFGGNGIKFEILSNSEASSSPDHVLGTLTNGQRKALLAACARGYYNVPRSVTLEQLALENEVNKSTFAEQLMKAENQVISWTVAKEASAEASSSS